MIKRIKEELAKTLSMLMDTQASDFKVYSAEEIKISDRSVGSKVELINPDGTLSDAPDGSYEMEGGFKFTVKDSLIESIEGEVAPDPAQEQEAETEQELEDPNAAPAVDELQALKDEVAQLRKDLDELKQIIVDHAPTDVAATKEDVNAFEAQVKELTDTIKKLASIPSEFSKTTTSNIIKDSMQEKKHELANIFADIKGK